MLYVGFGPASVQLFRDMCIKNGLDIPAPVTNSHGWLKIAVRSFAFVCLSTACTVAAVGQDAQYRTVRYPHHELSKTFIILNLTRVTVEGDGSLRFRGARWLQTAPLQFEQEHGSDAISFTEDNAGRNRF